MPRLMGGGAREEALRSVPALQCFNPARRYQYRQAHCWISDLLRRSIFNTQFSFQGRNSFHASSKFENMKYPKLIIVLAVTAYAILATTPNTRAASSAEIDQKSRAVFQKLYAKSPAARRVGQSAVAVLVFPEILKAGFIWGGQGGEGALISHGHTMGYYKTISASYGLQAGIQKFGYALFFMHNGDLDYLRKSRGWEIGSGPSLVIVDTGMAKSLTTTTLRKGVYAFIFSQRGLMAGLGLQGTKIMEIHPG